MAASFSLRVTPETLERKADEFDQIIREIHNRFNTIEDISSRTRGYWVGEAGDKDREGYASYKEDIAYVIKRLEEHPADLLTMAGIYRAAENEAVAGNSQLETDLIV